MCVNIFTRVFTLKNIRKIFIVFLVGFSCRVGIHFFLGINVFMDYLNFVSFVYYGFMSCFIITLDELFLEIPSSEGVRTKNSGVISNIYNDKDNVSGLRRRVRRPSAALIGLYGYPNNSVNTSSIIDPSINTNVRFRARVC